MRVIGLFFELLFAVLLILLVTICAYFYFSPAFGAAPSGDSLVRFQASSNFNGRHFKNLVTTVRNTREPGDVFRIFGDFISPPSDKNPQHPLPSKKFDRMLLENGKFVWLGHSTVLFKTSERTVLIDPVYHRVSPFPVFGEPFEMTKTPAITDLPSIDVVLISHDHYDHLDHLAIAKLNSMTGQFLVPLGIGSHLQHWGVPVEKIIELDWYETETIEGIAYTLTPSRHYSGRGISDNKLTLWGSWAVKSAELNVWFSGDGGYFSEFKKIGENYGPFDIAFIENGAYNPGWAQIHMMPEQSVQASIDVQAKVFFPIHWGKFDLAVHRWDEPIERATVAAKKLGVTMYTPVVGQVFSVIEAGSNDVTKPWWEFSGF